MPPVPWRFQSLVEVVDVPEAPGEPDRGGEHEPEAEALEELADDDDGAGDGEGGAEDGEERHPEVVALEAEELVADGARGLRHDDDLEAGPADELADVEHGRDVRAADAERGAEGDHRRDAEVAADLAGDGEQRGADDAADDGGDEGVAEAERRDEEAAGDEHEQADAEVAPEDAELEGAEAAFGSGDGADFVEGCGWRFGHLTSCVAHAPTQRRTLKVRVTRSVCSRQQKRRAWITAA